MVTNSSVLLFFQIFYIVIELATLFTRVCIKGSNLCTYCTIILVSLMHVCMYVYKTYINLCYYLQDIAYSTVLSGLYILGFVSSAIIGGMFPGVWEVRATTMALPPGTLEGIQAETIICLLVSVCIIIASCIHTCILCVYGQFHCHQRTFLRTNKVVFLI